MSRARRKPTLDITHPELAAQIHPDSPFKAHEVTFGSNKGLLWVCEQGHVWETKVKNRTTRGSVCRKCLYAPPGKTLDITHPELAKQIHPDSPVKAHEVTFGSNKELLWLCENGHTWGAMVNNRVYQSSGCSTCYSAPPERTLNLTHPELAAQIHPDSPFKAHEVTAGSAKAPLWVCKNGHTWEAVVFSRTKGVGCPKCFRNSQSHTLNLTHPELAAQIHPDSPFKAHEVTAGSAKAPLWVCKNGHTWKTKVSNRTLRQAGCLQCYKNARKQGTRTS